jgi:PsbP-like protein
MTYNSGFGPGFNAGTSYTNQLMRTVNFTRNLNYEQAKGLATPSSVTTDFKEYKNPSKGFKVQYPANWELKESDVWVQFISPLESSSDRYREGVNISVLPTDSVSVSLPAFVEDFTNTFRQRIPSFGVMWSEPTILSDGIVDYRAHELHFSMNVDNLFTEVNNIMMIHKGRLYIIEYHAELGKFYNDINNQIKSSFRYI